VGFSKDTQMIQLAPTLEHDDPAKAQDLITLSRVVTVSHRALVVAQHPMRLMCALVRLGCPSAGSVRPNGKPDHSQYDLILIKDAAELPSLDALVSRAIRWLEPGGRLIIGHVPRSAYKALKTRLRLNGFIIKAGSFDGIVVADRREIVG
jgi:hypothetical protein